MRFRFTVRRMMVVTALAALAIVGTRWVADMRKRASEYRFKAERHDLYREIALIKAKPLTAFLPSHRTHDETNPLEANFSCCPERSSVNADAIARML